jgi:hypothetical protein
MVRNCSPNTTSAKYRQANTVKSALFIREKEDEGVMSYSVSNENGVKSSVKYNQNSSYN